MSAKPINYKKWDHIEISDDEDDTHPNVDTPSLFRWRHQARVERMEQAKKEKDDFQAKVQATSSKYETAKKQLATLEAKKQSGLSETEEAELKKLQEQFEQLNKEKKRIDDEKRELEKKERLTPLNIDTICKEGKSRTIVNPAVRKKEVLTDEERVERLKKFAQENMPLIKKFGMLQKFEDSQRFLMENQQLVCEETASQLCLWAIDLEVEEKHALMEHVAHQAVVMNFIMELAKHLDRDPHSCVVPFFNRMSIVDKEREYIDAFRDELNSFKQRVRERAKVRIEEALRQYEEEERAKRIAASPGGLDPQEVFETLPESMKACFESRDIALLQQTVAQMDQQEAKYHIDRCIKSGLWVPGGGEQSDSAADDQEAQASAGQEDGSSSDYEEVEQADGDKKPAESAESAE